MLASQVRFQKKLTKVLVSENTSDPDAMLDVSVSDVDEDKGGGESALAWVTHVATPPFLSNRFLILPFDWGG